MPPARLTPGRGESVPGGPCPSSSHPPAGGPSCGRIRFPPRPHSALPGEGLGAPSRHTSASPGLDLVGACQEAQLYPQNPVSLLPSVSSGFRTQG